MHHPTVSRNGIRHISATPALCAVDLSQSLKSELAAALAFHPLLLRLGPPVSLLAPSCKAMLKVLDHPLGARSRTFQAHVHLISRLLLSFVLYLFASSHILAVVAQDVVNGQDVCQGFAIVDNPEANS